MHILLTILAIIAAIIFLIGLAVVGIIIYLLITEVRLLKQLEDEGFFDWYVPNRWYSVFKTI